MEGSTVRQIVLLAWLLIVACPALACANGRLTSATVASALLVKCHAPSKLVERGVPKRTALIMIQGIHY